jgi:hypothetical protein
MQAASILIALYLVALLQTAALLQTPDPPQPVAAGTFVGTWVGLQTVASNASPGVVEGQTVTMTIDLVDGRLVGTLTPFFGGSDGASFADAQVSGEELHASAVVGKPAPPVGRGAPPAWKRDTNVRFTLKADRTHLTGTGDVDMDGVKWMQYKYDLEKKRSRY